MREKTFKLSGQFISSYPIRKWKQNWLSIGRRWKIEETGYSQKVSQFMQKLQSGYRNSPVNSKQKGGRTKDLKGSLEEKNPNKQKRQDIGLSYGNFHTVTLSLNKNCVKRCCQPNPASHEPTSKKNWDLEESGKEMYVNFRSRSVFPLISEIPGFSLEDLIYVRKLAEVLMISYNFILSELQKHKFSFLFFFNLRNFHVNINLYFAHFFRLVHFTFILVKWPQMFFQEHVQNHN